MNWTWVLSVCWWSTQSGSNEEQQCNQRILSCWQLLRTENVKVCVTLSRLTSLFKGFIFGKVNRRIHPKTWSPLLRPLDWLIGFSERYMCPLPHTFFLSVATSTLKTHHFPEARLQFKQRLYCLHCTRCEARSSAITSFISYRLVKSNKQFN